jgi:hypothetical protein
MQFKGPGKEVYAVAIVTGCQDCETPAGVVLYAIPPSAREHFPGLGDIPVVPWVERGGWRELPIPIINRDTLEAAMREGVGESGEDETGEDVLAAGPRFFTDAALKTIAPLWATLHAPSHDAARAGAGETRE